MGMIAVQVYAKEIFRNAAPDLSSHLCSVMFALVLLSGVLMCALFSDRFGRKVSCASSALTPMLITILKFVLYQTRFSPKVVYS